MFLHCQKWEFVAVLIKQPIGPSTFKDTSCSSSQLYFLHFANIILTNYLALYGAWGFSSSSYSSCRLPLGGSGFVNSVQGNARQWARLQNRAIMQSLTNSNWSAPNSHIKCDATKSNPGRSYNFNPVYWGMFWWTTCCFSDVTFTCSCHPPLEACEIVYGNMWHSFH